MQPFSAHNVFYSVNEHNHQITFLTITRTVIVLYQFYSTSYADTNIAYEGWPNAIWIWSACWIWLISEYMLRGVESIAPMRTCAHFLIGLWVFCWWFYIYVLAVMENMECTLKSPPDYILSSTCMEPTPLELAYYWPTCIILVIRYRYLSYPHQWMKITIPLYHRM